MDRAKRERDEGMTAKCPEAAVEDNKGRKRESRITVIKNTSAAAPPLHHGLERSIARRLTEERWRERVEGRKNGRKKVKAMDGGSNRARDQRVGTTERLRRDACERQKGGEIERDG